MLTRDTFKIFDLIFKKLLRISRKALICLINAQFHTDYPLDSPVEYLNTEHFSEYLGHLFSDSVIIIDRKHIYHFEVEINNNPNMVLRMFVYGFEIGREHRDTSTAKKTGGIVIRFPRAKIFYWAPNSKTPDKLSLTLVFPDGTPHEFIVETYKPLEHSIAELEEKQMVLLLPFHVLKLRAAAKRTQTAADRRKLTGDIAELMKALVEATKQSVRDKILTEAERLDILDLMARLQKEVYSEYTENEETTMEIVNGEIRTLSEQISDLKAGLALAKRQAKKQTLNTARNFKAVGVSVDKIAAATGLAPEEIRKL
jgi:hypothetical protein